MIEIVDDCIRIVHADNGPGIPLEIRDKLFTKSTSPIRGGMGLYLCKKIITCHDGTLEIIDDSPYGSGAAFQIMIPLVTHK